MIFVRQNGKVTHTGKRAGPRRKRRFSPALLLLSIGVTLCVVAWGYLVKAAIDFGATAREGDQEAWWFLGVASLGAVACLFVGLMLASRILRRLGITGSDSSEPTPAPREPSIDTAQIPTVAKPTRPVGGHRR